MELKFPDELIKPTGLSEADLLLELAVALYARRKIGRVQASKVADLDLFDFQHVLKEREIAPDYDETDLEKELANFEKARVLQ